MYFLSAIEDHIAPWKTTFLGTDLVGGDVEFVLGGSGHIAGVVNPPAKINEITGPMVRWDRVLIIGWKRQQIIQGLGGIIGISGSISTIRNKCQRVGANTEFKEIVPAPGDYVGVRL